MDWNVITSNLPLLLYGALMTIKITAVAVSLWFHYWFNCFLS